MSNKEFRAKVYSRNRRTGEYHDCGWVYGDFYRYYNGSLNYTIAAIDPDEMDTKEYSVEGTTVGQWSGLYDKNKKKIFEGDRIVTRWVNVVNSDKPVTEIYYTVTNVLDFEIMYKMQCADEIEVIGNVHDSPELHDGSNTA